MQQMASNPEMMRQMMQVRGRAAVLTAHTSVSPPPPQMYGQGGLMADPQMMAQMMQVSWLGGVVFLSMTFALSAESILPADDAADDEQPSGHGAGQFTSPAPCISSLPPSLPPSLLPPSLSCGHYLSLFFRCYTTIPYSLTTHKWVRW